MSLPSAPPPAPRLPPSRPSGDQAARPPRGLRLFTWLMLAAMVGPCAVAGVPREIGRWELVFALRERAAGEHEAASARLAEAMRWFPDNPQLLLQRAEWRLEDGDKDGAFADVDRMLEAGGERPRWLEYHAQFLQSAGEFKRAVADWKKLDVLSQQSGRPSREEALNGLAYARALAKVELDEALVNVNQALELDPKSAAILDTRGYILHLVGQNCAALKDMNESLKIVNESVARAQIEKRRAAPSKRDRAGPWQPRTMYEPFDLGRVVAVMHYHRALVFEALGRKAGAEADMQAAKQLSGQEPDETLF